MARFVVKFSAWMMDEIYVVSLTGAGNARKMRSVALEYPARLLLERWR